MYVEGAEKSVQAAKKSPECLNLFGLTMEMVEPPRARKFEVMGETKCSEERHINNAEYALSEE